MIKTLPIHKFDDMADNIYEAIIVLSKRARQINDLQKQELSRGREYDDEYDDYRDEEIIEDPSETKYVKLHKPASVALEDFFAKRVKYEYREKSDENEQTES